MDLWCFVFRLLKQCHSLFKLLNKAEHLCIGSVKCLFAFDLTQYHLHFNNIEWVATVAWIQCDPSVVPAVSYYAYYGKKLDPEPWRCRRTDGKKWRCSKEAAPDSKYCERHMHRGRNRSRKPVETQLVPQSQPPATAAASPAAPLAAAANGSSFQNHSLYPAIAGSTGGGGGASNMSSLFSSPLGSSPLHMDNAASYAALGGGTAKDLKRLFIVFFSFIPMPILFMNSFIILLTD